MLSIVQQCELLGLARSSYYYEPVPEREENLRLLRLLDEQYTRTPFYGTRKMTAWLHTQGYPVDRKRVRRLLRLMGLEAIYPKPRTSVPGAVEQRYPYLLRGMSIERCHQVWSCDITYIRLQRGFIYLMAVIDWFSRYVLSWEISVTLDTSFCLEALDRALRVATPEIFNTDQGVQFTSAEFTNRLKAADIRISWDGRGRALDNIFVERLWRSVKYEEVSIKDYHSVLDAVSNLQAYFTFYNHERIHQALSNTSAGLYEQIRRVFSNGCVLSYFRPKTVLTFGTTIETRFGVANWKKRRHFALSKTHQFRFSTSRFFVRRGAGIRG